MKYGFFDEQAREYCVTNPATPAPWANYLGSPEYGAIISNNAGGYSFEKSGASGRILRYRFNDNDDPGRYIYLRDDADGDFWSASWQPVGKPLDVYSSECRHGTGYTLIKAGYKGIDSCAAYYVPMGATHEVWQLTVTNNSNTVRNISVFGYAEFTTDSNYEQDQVNLQYTQFITRTYFDGNRIRQTINENCVDAFNGNSAKCRFFGLSGAQIDSYCGDKAEFLGRYNGYGRPQAVTSGDCGNKLNYNGNPCGGLHTRLTLAPGESKTIAFVLGQKTQADADAIMARYAEPAAVCAAEIDELRTYWHGKLNNFTVKTPDEEFNSMINTWNAYQCFITFVWSRAASFSYCGQRNGYGYRDTVQDIQGIIHLDPEMAREQLVFMLSAQVSNGAGLPLVKYTHNPGHEDTPDDESYVRSTGHPHYRADDALWLFPTVTKYIGETGKLDFLDYEIPYADKETGTVYDHLKRAIDFSLNHLAAHGMPAGLHADWNDCLRMGEKGESVFVAMQLYLGMKTMSEYAALRNDAEYKTFIDAEAKKLYDIIQNLCWEGDRYIRGIRDTGEVVGSKNDPEASMWLNPQSWGVISGVSDEAQGIASLDSVYNLLNTAYGARLLAPSYKQHAFDGALMMLFNGSTKENGAIFCQSQGWLILAEAMLGRGDRAYEYFRETSPACMNDKADIRVLEPYAHNQFVESVESPYEGRAHVHWLTGTASTVMVGCVEGILGMRPDAGGLRIAPSISSTWDKVEISKSFRGCQLNITIENPNGKQSGVTECLLNGVAVADGYIPADQLKATNEIIVRM